MSKESNRYDVSTSLWFPLSRTTLHRHPHCTCDIAARSIHKYTHIRLEEVAWAALSYAGPGDVLPVGLRSGTEPPTTCHATPPRSAQRVPLSKSTAVTELVVSCTTVRGFTGVCGRIRHGGSIRYDVAASLPFFYDPSECPQSAVSSIMGMHVVRGFSLLQPATCFSGSLPVLLDGSTYPWMFFSMQALRLQISSVCTSYARIFV